MNCTSGSYEQKYESKHCIMNSSQSVLFTEYYMCCADQMRWAGCVTHVRQMKNAYNILLGKREGKRPLRRARCRWKDNIKIDINEIGQRTWQSYQCRITLLKKLTKRWIPTHTPDSCDMHALCVLTLSWKGGTNWKQAHLTGEWRKQTTIPMEQCARVAGVWFHLCEHHLITWSEFGLWQCMILKLCGDSYSSPSHTPLCVNTSCHHSTTKPDHKFCCMWVTLNNSLAQIPRFISETFMRYCIGGRLYGCRDTIQVQVYGSWRRVGLRKDTNVSEDTAASIFTKLHSLHPEDGGSKVLRKVGILPQHYTASQDNSNSHRCENLKPQNQTEFCNF